MDLNKRLIDAVRQCHLLYDKNASIEDRKFGWQQIAQQLELEEPILKARWHFLCGQFLRRYDKTGCEEFPYKNQMKFMLPYLKSLKPATPEKEVEFLPLNVTKPEFVITEKDFETCHGKEEFIFLEVETLCSEEETNGDQGTVDWECQSEEVLSDSFRSEESLLIEINSETPHYVLPNTEDGESYCKNTNEVIEIDKEKFSESLEEGVPNDTETIADENEAITDENDETITDEAETIFYEAEIVTETDKHVENNAGNNAGSYNGTGERCEDAIFGELVTAMLKRMPEEQKREVKRNIMNALLA